MISQLNFFKTIGAMFAFLLSGHLMLAQNTEEIARDTTEITFKDKRILIISDEDGKSVEVKEKKDVIVIEERYEEGDDEYDREYESEYDEEYEDYYDEGDYNPDYEHKDKDRDHKRTKVGFMALDLGITNYYQNGVYGVDAGSPELELRQFRPGAHVALHLFPTQANLFGNGAVNLKTALTIDWNNHYYANDITLINGEEGLSFDTTGTSFTRNKLAARYVQIPLLLNIDTKPGSDKGTTLSFGVYGGVLWKAWTKQVFEEGGVKKVDRVDGTYHLNPIRYGVMARLDFRWMDVYVMYNLSQLFDEGQEPQTQMLMAGINLIDF